VGYLSSVQLFTFNFVLCSFVCGVANADLTSKRGEIIPSCGQTALREGLDHGALAPASMKELSEAVEKKLGGEWFFTGRIDYPRILSGRTIYFIFHTDELEAHAYVYDITEAMLNSSGELVLNIMREQGKQTLPIEVSNEWIRRGVYIKKRESDKFGGFPKEGTRYAANHFALMGLIAEAERVLASADRWRDPDKVEEKYKIFSGRDVYGMSVDPHIGSVSIFHTKVKDRSTNSVQVFVPELGLTWVPLRGSQGRPLVMVRIPKSTREE
jgi:hypothetical protein